MEVSIAVVSRPDPPSSEYHPGLSCDSNELRKTNTSSIPDEHSPETLLILSHADSPTLSKSNLLSVVASSEGSNSPMTVADVKVCEIQFSCCNSL